VLGALNRETICFLTLAYALTAWGKTSLRSMLLHVALQTAIILSIKLVLGRLFLANGGATAEVHTARNLEAFTTVNHDTVRIALAFGFCWLFIPLAWKSMGSFHRRLLWVVPPFVAVMTVAGILGELRIYNELIPILTLPMVIALFPRDATSPVPA
jgi:hypothetical protein